MLQAEISGDVFLAESQIPYSTSPIIDFSILDLRFNNNKKLSMVAVLNKMARNSHDVGLGQDLQII